MKKLILSSILFCVLAVPAVSQAQAPFGGMVVGTPIPCTCTNGVLLYWFAPLYLSLVPTTGDLAGLPAVTFPFFNLSHSGQWALGIYTPGLQTCYMWVGKACVLFPTLGRITPFTGVSGTSGISNLFTSFGDGFGGGGASGGFGTTSSTTKTLGQ